MVAHRVAEAPERCGALLAEIVRTRAIRSEKRRIAPGDIVLELAPT